MLNTRALKNTGKSALNWLGLVKQQVVSTHALGFLFSYFLNYLMQLFRSAAPSAAVQTEQKESWALTWQRRLLRPGAFAGFTFPHVLLFNWGMRKDRGRVMRRDRQRTASSDSDKVPRVLERRAAPPQDKRKHTGGGAGRGGKSTAVTSISPDQVWRPWVIDIHLKRKKK